jgi:transposase
MSQFSELNRFARGQTHNVHYTAAATRWTDATKLAASKRGRGTLKQPVFGIFERGGAVFTEIVPDVKAKTLQAIIQDKVSPECIVMTDGWQSYNGLVNVGYDKHFRIKKYRKEGNPFTDGPVHVNGIESFWSYAKQRLARFIKANFELHLKECEWGWGKDPDTILAELKTVESLF